MNKHHINIFFIALASILMLTISAIPHHHHHQIPCFNTELHYSDCNMENNHEGSDCFFHSVFNLGQKINETRASDNEFYVEFILFIFDNLIGQTQETKIDFLEYPILLTSAQKSNPLGLRAPPHLFG